MSRRKKSTPIKPTAGHRRSTRGSLPVDQPEEFDDMPAVPMNRLEMEQQMSELSRILAEQEFESVEDANEFLQNLMKETGGRIPHKEPETPAEKAMQLVIEAESAPERRARKLIRDALKLDPMCVDAYVLQGEMAESLEQAIKFYRQAVEVGEKALGQETFEQESGYFWGLVETRPYMRALQTLASVLWVYGEVDESIAIYQKMLELNPGDNQGVRYELLSALILMRRHDEAQSLLDAYDDGMADWLYNKALLLFRTEGRSKRARDAMQDALDTNELVADFLLGFEDMPGPDEVPDFIQFGEESEAAAYVVKSFPLWASTPGAQYWLQENI